MKLDEVSACKGKKTIMFSVLYSIVSHLASATACVELAGRGAQSHLMALFFRKDF